jgi:hypothetical protein
MGFWALWDNLHDYVCLYILGFPVIIEEEFTSFTCYTFNHLLSSKQSISPCRLIIFSVSIKRLPS